MCSGGCRSRRETTFRREAASKRPARSSRASVNAPLRWPNSSLSNSVWLTAPKSTDMKFRPRAWTVGAAAGRLAPCRRRSRRGSGRSRRSARPGARSRTLRASPAIDRPWVARRPPPRRRARARACAGADLVARVRAGSSAAVTVATSFSFCHGFKTKSVAPDLIALTAVEMSPYAVISTTTMPGSISRMRSSHAGLPRRCPRRARSSCRAARRRSRRAATG